MNNIDRERCFQDGVKVGKDYANRNILESVIKAATVKVALKVLVWIMFCEFVDQKVPTENRKEKAMQIFKEEVENWS